MSNIQPYIILNGTDSRSISGLLISSLPPISKPQVRTQIETVDGRDGDIITPLGFSAYDKVINIGLTYNYDVDEIIEFFNSEGIVTFSNEPDKYYRYAIYEQIDFEKLIKFKTAEVTLHVQPFKFSTTEEPELFDVVSGQAIAVTNEGNTDSRPNLTIIGSGDIDVSLNGSQILSIELEDDQAVIIDSEDMNAYAAQSAIREVVADIQAKQAGSGDPSPSNIREISGYNAAIVSRCGKNLLNNSDKTITSGSCVINNVKCPMVAGYYILSFDFSGTSNSSSLRIDDENGTPVFTTAKTITSGHNEFLINLPSKASFVKLFANAVGTYSKFQIERGNQFTIYEAYNGQTFNIPFVDDQGDPITVYGGSLNVTTGELTIDKGFDIINGSVNWSTGTTARFRYFDANVLSDNSINWSTNVLSNMFAQQGVYPYAQIGGGARTLRLSFDINDTSITSVEQLKSLLNQTPLQVVYPLATPTEIQLTPTQINNLLGLNNMYSDTGDITVKHKSNGVIVTDTGAVVSFYAGLDDIEKGVLLNRAITGDYDKIRLRKGVNTFVLTGNAQQFAIDKFSRWI